jgi:hypothetical protein
MHRLMISRDKLRLEIFSFFLVVYCKFYYCQRVSSNFKSVADDQNLADITLHEKRVLSLTLTLTRQTVQLQRYKIHNQHTRAAFGFLSQSAAAFHAYTHTPLQNEGLVALSRLVPFGPGRSRSSGYHHWLSPPLGSQWH